MEQNTLKKELQPLAMIIIIITYKDFIKNYYFCYRVSSVYHDPFTTILVSKIATCLYTTRKSCLQFLWILALSSLHHYMRLYPCTLVEHEAYQQEK